VRRLFVFEGLIFKYLPLTPALSPFGGEREKNQTVSPPSLSIL
jgi:hypothetical protein